MRRIPLALRAEIFSSVSSDMTKEWWIMYVDGESCRYTVEMKEGHSVTMYLKKNEKRVRICENDNKEYFYYFHYCPRQYSSMLDKLFKFRCKYIVSKHHPSEEQRENIHPSYMYEKDNTHSYGDYKDNSWCLKTSLIGLDHPLESIMKRENKRILLCNGISSLEQPIWIMENQECTVQFYYNTHDDKQPCIGLNLHPYNLTILVTEHGKYIHCIDCHGKRGMYAYDLVPEFIRVDSKEAQNTKFALQELIETAVQMYKVNQIQWEDVRTNSSSPNKMMMKQKENEQHLSIQIKEQRTNEHGTFILYANKRIHVLFNDRTMLNMHPPYSHCKLLLRNGDERTIDVQRSANLNQYVTVAMEFLQLIKLKRDEE